MTTTADLTTGVTTITWTGTGWRIVCQHCGPAAELHLCLLGASEEAEAHEDLHVEEAEPTTIIAAADLRPGMIVTDHLGHRRFAAFDVAPYEPRRWVTDEPDVPMVQVWTAIQDQDAGQPASILIVADDPITVRDAR